MFRNCYGNIFCDVGKQRLLIVLVEPFDATLVGKVLNLKVGEASLESLSVGACCYRSDLQRTVVLHPECAHHSVFLVVEAVEKFDSIESANSLEPKIRDRLLELNDAPVGSSVCDNGRDVELAVDKFDAALHIVFVVETNHQSCLVEAYLVVAANLDFSFKFATVCGIKERAVVDGKAVVSDAPIISLGRYVHFESATIDSVRFGFVEPLHLVEVLCVDRHRGRDASYSRDNKLFHDK